MSSQSWPGGLSSLLVLAFATHLYLTSGLPASAGKSELNFDWRALSSVPVEQLCALAATTSEDHGSAINEVSLAHNEITLVQAGAFTCLARALKIINLRHNRIKFIAESAFEALDSVQVLQLEHNLLSQVPSRGSLKPLSSLRHLNLAYNRIEAIHSEAFGPENGQLISLDLKGNPLRHISGDALVNLARLQTLILSQSALSGTASRLFGLTELRFYYLDRATLQVSPPDLCANSRKLTSLILKSNQLQEIPQFLHCQSLLLLDLSYNQIRGSLNESFMEQANLIDLYLGHNRIEFVHERAFVGLTKLQVLELSDNHLQQIHTNAFLPIRSTLYDLNLSNNPRLAQLDAHGLDQLSSLKAYGNLQLRILPHFRSASSLALTYAYHCCDYLELESPWRAPSAGPQPVSPQASAGSLLAELFSSLMSKLSGQQHWAPDTPPSGNQREEEDLNLSGGDREVSQLNELVLWPESHGQLADVEMNVWRTEILGPKRGRQVRNFSRISEWPEVAPPRHRRVAVIAGRGRRGATGDNAHLIDGELLASHLNQIRDLHSVALTATALNDHTGVGSESAGSEWRTSSVSARARRDTRAPIHCLPKPGPFLPCQDLFDTWWLRVGIWMVFLLAFTGNILVIIVLGSVRPSSSTSALTSIMWLAHSKRHIDVPRFLVINLAVADLLMAMYLGLLAFVDLSTLGEFKVFAIKWQYSTGCKLAGFLGVLSSELSVFILAVITLERNYAITNAVHLNRRLSLQKAMVIMMFGYTFALAMAIMPLNGISDYRKFSICLPLDMDSSWSSQMYVITLVGINTFSFLLLLSCYLRMYCAIRGSQAWNTNDLRIAKRMSILVITDFLCWMPIIVAAMASFFGYHLIGVKGIKIITIFILPLNSVANPFLYAITTKKFKRDLDTLMSRMRSVTRLDCCHQADNKDPKLFSGYNHQYQQNLMMMNKKRQLDALDDSRRLAERRRRRQPHYVTCNPLTLNQVTANRTTCSLQRPMREPLTQVRSCLTQPKIVLDPAESTLAVDFVPCGLIKKSLSTNSAALLEARYCLPVGTANASKHHITVAQGDGNNQATGWRLPFSQRAVDLVVGERRVFDDCRSCKPVLIENPSSDLRLEQQQQQHYLSVLDGPADRSASACGYPAKDPSEKHGEVRVTGSYDTVRMDRQSSGLKISRSINRLLFGPIAKAWSSIQISLTSSNTQLGHQISNKHLQQTGCVSSPDKKEPPNSTTIDDILLMSSPSSRLMRLSERRMSRSCDIISNQQQSASMKSPVSSNDATTSHFDYDDDQRILLATINRIAAGRHKVKVDDQIPGGNQETRNRCTRCRSWSPALLSKLEECIHQFRFRLPSFGGTAKSEHQTQHDIMPMPSDSHDDTDTNQRVLSFDDDEEGDVVDEDEINGREGDGGSQQHHRSADDVDLDDEEDDDDKFNETCLLEWSQRRKELAKRYRFGRQKAKLQHQSSNNSDTLSTRTGATLLTNMSLSIDSNTSIPVSGQRATNDGDQRQRNDSNEADSDPTLQE